MSTEKNTQSPQKTRSSKFNICLDDDQFDIFINRHPEVCPNGVLGIDWSANIGFGRWVLYLDDDNVPHIRTEYLDSQDDKHFSELILKKLLEKAIIDD